MSLSFYFVTRCYSDYLARVLRVIEQCPPDVIIMNSCLWDLHRYGPHGPAAFRKNLTKLLEHVNERFPDSLFIWTATLPVDKGCKAGFLPLGGYQMVQSNEIMEGNFVAYMLVREFGCIFLDLNKHFRNMLHQRSSDGVHWNAIGHRRITFFILTEIRRLWWGWGTRIPYVGEIQAPPFRHHRSASLPEVGFCYNGRKPPCQQIPLTPYLPSFPKEQERAKQPRFDDDQVWSQDFFPAESTSIGRQPPQNNSLVRARNGVFSAVRKCFSFGKKRSYSEIEHSQEMQAKRLCIRNQAKYGVRESNFQEFDDGSRDPWWVNQCSWYNTNISPQMSHNSRHVENPQCLEPFKPLNNFRFCGKFQDWYKSKFQNLRDNIISFKNSNNSK